MKEMTDLTLNSTLNEGGREAEKGKGKAPLGWGELRTPWKRSRRE
jgi:hypothetical protein